MIFKLLTCMLLLIATMTELFFYSTTGALTLIQLIGLAKDVALLLLIASILGSIHGLSKIIGVS